MMCHTSTWEEKLLTARLWVQEDTEVLDPAHHFEILLHDISRIVTESQNVRGWKGPLWVTQSNPLPKQGHPEQAAQDRVQAGLEYLQRRRLHSLPGQPGPGLRHPQREEVLPYVQTELPLLQFVPMAPCPVAGHH